MLEAILQADGHEVVGTVLNGADLVKQAKSLQPDLIITDIVMPEITGIEAASEIYAERPTAIIILSGFSDEELVRKGFQNHAITYLLKPVDRKQLRAAIVMALEHHEHLMELREETDSLEQALEGRKVIERAKGVLMERLKLTEDQAHRKLLTTARSQNLKLVDLANTLLKASQLI